MMSLRLAIGVMLLQLLAAGIGCKSEPAKPTRPEAFGAYSGDGRIRLQQHSLTKTCTTWTHKCNFYGSKACAFGVPLKNEDEIQSVSKPEVLLYIPDPAQVEKWTTWVDVKNEQKCDCGACVSGHWNGTREVRASIKPLGEGLFLVAPSETSQNGIYSLAKRDGDDVTGYVFRVR